MSSFADTRARHVNEMLDDLAVGRHTGRRFRPSRPVDDRHHPCRERPPAVLRSRPRRGVEPGATDRRWPGEREGPGFPHHDPGSGVVSERRSPTIRRRRLGAELRRQRESAGITIETVAEQLECSASKISRIETGHTTATPRDVRDRRC
jgi:hypothetical protein